MEGLVKLMGGVKSRRTPGDMDLDETPVENEEDVKLYRSGVGTLLYIAGDRPDVQFLVKELASKLQKPTKGAMNTLKRLIGYLHTTMDYHVKMTGRDPSASFRDRAQGLSTTPSYVDSKDIWLVEVATDSDWSGNRITRSSTSCGCIFIGGIWIFSFSRTQRNITLSSTESEFVALVSGAAEGLLIAAVLRHVVNEAVELKVFADNNAAVCIASREGGVGRLRHLDGRLLWIQQRNNRDFQLRRVDTISNPADLGTKTLGGKRVKLLLNLLGFSNDMEDLGFYELEEEDFEEGETVKRSKPFEKSFMQKFWKLDTTNPVLWWINLQSGWWSWLLVHFYWEVEKPWVRAVLRVWFQRRNQLLPLTVPMLVTINFALMLVVMLVLKIAYNMHKRVQENQETLKWVRRQLDRRADRRMIRAEEEARTGIYLESADGESEEEEANEANDDAEVRAESETMNGTAFIRMVLHEEGEEEEAEMEDIEIEPEPGHGHAGGDHGTDHHLEDDGYDYEDPMDDEEEAEESGFETDYGSLCCVDENESDYEGLDEEGYDDYRFHLLGEACGVEHYLLKKLASLRKTTITEELWYEIKDMMNLQKAVQLGSAATRRDVIDYLRNRRRYISHVNAGRVPRDERLDESEMPDAWIAAHYRWKGFRTRFQQEDDDEEVSWLADDAGGAAGEGAEEREEEPPVASSTGDPISVVVDAVAADLMTALDEMDDGRGSASDRLRADPKAKAGGKGRDNRSDKDPLHEDEADGNVWEICLSWNQLCTKGRV